MVNISKKNFYQFSLPNQFFESKTLMNFDVFEVSESE